MTDTDSQWILTWMLSWTMILDPNLISTNIDLCIHIIIYYMQHSNAMFDLLYPVLVSSTWPWVRGVIHINKM